MNEARIKVLLTNPTSASIEEITLLASLALLEARRRHALFKIVTIALPLLPSTSRGGAMSEIHQAAVRGLDDATSGAAVAGG